MTASQRWTVTRAAPTERNRLFFGRHSCATGFHGGSINVRNLYFLKLTERLLFRYTMCKVSNSAPYHVRLAYYILLVLASPIEM